MRRVLVTDGEERSTLAVVRSLGRSGCEVHVLSRSGGSIAGRSRYSASDMAAPDPSVDPNAYVARVGARARDVEADFLIPMTDVSATLCLGLRTELGGCVIPFPPEEMWAVALDKAAMAEVARTLDVPTPRQVVIGAASDGLEEAFDFAAAEGYPVVLKPHRSALVTDEGVAKFGVCMAGDRNELEMLSRGFPDSAFPVLVQHRVEGPGLGGFFLCDRGRVVAAFAHQRLREKPPTGGVSVLREGIALRADVGRCAVALLEHLRWSGVAMVEFKEDASTGVPYLMEINGRFWGSLQLAIDSGVDFPRLLLEAFAQGSGSGRDGTSLPQTPVEYVVGRRSRWFWGDVDHLLAVVRMNSGDREALGLPGRFIALLRFLTPMLSRGRLEVFDVTDIRPFIHESGLWLRHVLRR